MPLSTAHSAPSPAADTRGRDCYLDLMKRALTNWLYRDMDDLTLGRNRHDERAPWRGDFVEDWRRPSHTMASMKRLDNVQRCVEDVITAGVPGDLIETGVWRGGVTILMRAILAAYGVTDRTVWVADSFEGMPVPRTDQYPHDKGCDLSSVDILSVSLAHVQSYFDRYGLLDGQVRFLQGWFRDTLPTAPIESLAVLRLDGDLYESTMDGLVNLYPKLSVGGYLIIDDYGSWPTCRQAVHDYRAAHGITEPIQAVDWTCSYWQRRR